MISGVFQNSSVPVMRFIIAGVFIGSGVHGNLCVVCVAGMEAYCVIDLHTTPEATQRRCPSFPVSMSYSLTS